MSRRFSLRTLFLLAMVALVHLVAAVYTVIVFETRQADAIHNADAMMLAGATFVRDRLGTNFHDRIVDAHSLSRAEFDNIVARNDQLCQKLGLQYIWSLLELDGRYVFTSATHMVLTNQLSDCATFLAVHSNPNAYTNAFATMQREFSTFKDKWGEGRMVLLPGLDVHHRKYLFAASIQMADFKALLRRTLLESILAGLLIASLFSLLAWALSRMIAQPLTRLTAELERMRRGELTGEIQRGHLREVAVLADAFAAMRHAVRDKVEALRESEERYRGLVDSIGLGVTLISPQMEILALNRQHRMWFPEIRPDHRPLCYQAFNNPARDSVCTYCPVVKTLQDGQPHEAITATPREGRIINYRIRSAPLTDPAGRISAVIETVEDITERQRVEEALKRSEANLSAIADSTDDLIFLLDAQTGRLLQFNNAFAREIAHTYQVAVHIGMTGRDILPPDRLPVWEALLHQVQQQGSLTTDYLRPSDQRHFEVNFSTIKTGAQITGVAVFIRDITARKRAEYALRESEAKLRVLFNILPVGISLVDAQHQIISMNPTLGRIMGLSEDEMRQGQYRQRRLLRGDGSPLPADEIPSVRALRENGEVHNTEVGIVREDGSTHWVVVSAAPLPGVGVAVATRDIAAFKRTQEALRASRAQLVAVLESTQDMIWSVDAQTFAVLEFNSAFARFIQEQFGVTLRPLMTAREILPDDRFAFWERLMRNALGTNTGRVEYQVPGTDRHLEVTFNPIRTGEHLTALSLFARDITARKRAEAARLASENQLRAFLENSALIGWLKDEDGRHVFVSENFLRHFRMRREDWIGKTDFDIWPRAQAEILQRNDRAVLEHGQTLEVVEQVNGPDGRPSWWMSSKFLFVDAAGRRFVGGVGVNITERVQAEAALRESQAQLAGVLESTQDLIWSVDPQSLELLSFNSAFAQEIKATYGFDLRPGSTLRDVLPAEKIPVWEQLLQRALRDGRYNDEYFRAEHPKHFELTFNPIVKAGQPGRVAVFARDITARKRSEEALRESEANFRAFFESVTDLIVVGTPEGRILFTNATVPQTLGYTPDEIRTMHLLDLHPHDRRPEAEHIFAAMFRGERSTCPLPLARKDGSLVPVETRVWFGRWNGEPCVFGLSKNLTAEQEAQQRFERLFRHNPALMALSTVPDRTFADINDAFIATLGFSRDEIIGKTTAELGLIPQAAHQAALAEQLRATGRVAGYELQVRRKDGVLLDGLFSGELITSQGRQYFLTVMVDITDRRRLEQQLLEISEREQRRIGQDLHDGVGQQLAAMRFQSSTLLQKLAARKKVSLAEVERLDTLLEETLKQVRNLSRGLHPVGLDSQGLMHGLRELARQCQTLFGVACTFECTDTVQLHDQRAALNLYRIAQEATRNAAVHGAPQHIRLQLTGHAGGITLTITDDGRGLPAHVKETTGLGLAIMRYRAASIGASCAIHSQPGAGVTIRCVWQPTP